MGIRYELAADGDVVEERTLSWARRFADEAGTDVWDDYGVEVPIVRMSWRSLDALAEATR